MPTACSPQDCTSCTSMIVGRSGLYKYLLKIRAVIPLPPVSVRFRFLSSAFLFSSYTAHPLSTKDPVTSLPFPRSTFCAPSCFPPFQLSPASSVCPHYLHSSEFFVKAFDLPINSGSLRNAIGHSDYKYDGIKQIISYPQKDGSDIMLNSYLIDVALECSKMLRSTLLLIFVTYELIRYNHRSDNSTMPMHSIIYKNVRSQSLCPCGSRRKYIHCCKSIIHVDKKSNTNFDYPMEADFCMSDNFKRMKP